MLSFVWNVVANRDEEDGKEDDGNLVVLLPLLLLAVFLLLGEDVDGCERRRNDSIDVVWLVDPG